MNVSAGEVKKILENVHNASSKGGILSIRVSKAFDLLKLVY